MRNLYPPSGRPNVISSWKDDQGRTILRIRLGSGPLAAVVTEDDYDTLAMGDLVEKWYANAAKKGGAPYVRTFLPDGRLVVVARLIAKTPDGWLAGPGQQVTYRNGNRLDLRPENLMIEPGRSKHDAESDLEGAILARVEREDAEEAATAARDLGTAE